MVHRSQWQRDVRFAKIEEILASSATHCFSPLWQSFPHLLDLQIRLGVGIYERTFGRSPVGFWLPECAFFPGLERLLWQSQIRYFFLDAEHKPFVGSAVNIAIIRE